MAQVLGSGVPGGSAGKVVLVGFESAKEFWRDDSNLGVLDDCFDPEGRLAYADVPDLSKAVTTSAELSFWSIGIYEERPLDVLAPHRAKTDCALVNLHQVCWHLPGHSFVAGREGVLVASPELLFLECAATYSFVELLKLGMELCGTYAPDEYEPDGCTPRRKICTVGRIRRYLSWCKGAPGLRQAKVAVNYLLDGSNSPLETEVMLGLTLPPRHRGIGLRKPVLNERRDATSLQAETIGEHTYFFDARWSGKLSSGLRYCVDCEVDSHGHFNDSRRARADVVRKDNIQYMQVTHLSITSDDLESADAFMRKGLMIAKHIGQRVRRYPRRGTEEQKEEFEREWKKRLRELDGLLSELKSDAHPPRPRPEELKELKKRRAMRARGQADGRDGAHQVSGEGQPSKNA